MRVAAVLMLMLAGCGSSTEGEKRPEPPFALSFDFGDPAELLHGAEREFAVQLRRAEGFTSPVTLRAEVSPADRGVTARIDEKTMKAVVNVSETAQPGEYLVQVIGRGPNDVEAVVDLALKVPRKD
jgi:hypothetical protein